ncbi:nucleoside triphosphate pyrophosphohydrolase [Clostridium acetireducens DSM 10703]|jgi:tetrapyrrole methylase family protein/MazG family protein|uniref:Nucleoside triphosphate pyrophosphohydrolase n=1 Tax=Clostridium acetireducens DSM 10703 TaxID=1121290 RepID=A0A1E8EZW7_9CLOT|nr:nucleoside triphosphate pyrophosphohydrolase [Clostridium acetireducens]OFI06572.1 nucleoside triphosphate pyrophosphohydrolase [Clostridium acetireducens DSM 10703]
MIKIVGLGPGSKNSITIGVLESLKKADKIYLRTNKHPNVEYLKSIGLEFETFDYMYDNFNNFDEVYKSIAIELINKYKKYGNIIYAVPGHPLVAEKSVNILIELCKKEDIDIDILPAVSFIESIIERLKIDPINGLKIIDAFDIKNQVLDKRVGIIVTQLYNKLIASEVKLDLMNYYGDDEEIYFVRAAGVEGLESIRKIPLYELDRQEDIDYLTSIYIPKNNNLKDFNDLIKIMSTLRGENGCPWDREQTHKSLKQYLIEESYEVLDSIDEEDDEALVEELGDVLLQVVFHSQIGKENGFFNINDVVKSICDKMIERHPHVFGNVNADTTDKVLYNWDKIKKKQYGFNTYTDELNHIAKSFPALIRAYKVQKKAAKVGFDWDDVIFALDKVLEELYEVKNVYKEKNRAKILEEVGDLLFSCVNVARFLDINPELALNYTIDKFINRFEYIEKSALSKGVSIEDMTLEEMDNLWEKSKTIK